MHSAAVLTAVGSPLEIRRDVEVAAPRAGEIAIRLAASGVCHSDLSMRNGTLMGPTPMVLGHEGAGVVTDVGDGVTGFSPGDLVVVSWVPQCGQCFFCRRGQPHLCDEGLRTAASGGLLDGTTRLTAGGIPLFQMAGTGTFSEYAVIPAIAAVGVPADVDPRVAALIGCGVLTGVGAALNTARIAAGDTVAVVGCGGVGLNVIQGARLAGAGAIVAVDVNAGKLEMAREFGATATVDASVRNAVSAVMGLTGERGADVAFEVVGSAATIDAAVGMTRRGGETVLVGIPAMDTMVSLPAFFGLILAEKRISGCWYGSSDVRRDVPRILEWWRAGDLRLSELISREITLDDVNDSLTALESGHLARSVIVY